MIRHLKNLAFAATLLGGATSGAAAPRDEPRELASNLLKTSDLVGCKVENGSGENLGKIEDVVLDTATGKVNYAVLSFGGFLGIGDKLFAIPWEALRHDEKKAACILSVDKERLKAAPGFDKNHWPNMASPQFRDTVHTFYRVPVAATLPALDEQRSEDWSFLKELRREGVRLPLALREGSSYRFRIEGAPEWLKARRIEPGAAAAPGILPGEPRDPSPTGLPAQKTPGEDGAREVTLRVTSASGDEAQVELTCNATGQSLKARVARDGSVYLDSSRPTAAADAERPNEEARSLLFLRHVFGQGLHKDTLVAGKEYSMPGSLLVLGTQRGQLSDPVAGPEGRSRGTLPAEDHPAPGKSTAVPTDDPTSRSPGNVATDVSPAGNHVMRFEGRADCQGKPLAIFTVASTSADLPADPTAAAATPSAAKLPQDADEGRSGIDRAANRGGVVLHGHGKTGKAAYNTEDGILELARFGGMTVRRIDGTAASAR